MSGQIQAGSIFIDGNAGLPRSVHLEAEPNSSGWAEIKDATAALGNGISDTGWTFFFMAGEIKATVFGFDREKALGTALSRLIANVKTQQCNSIEITQVTGDSFLKLPYVRVTAHPRHLQKGQTFIGPR